MNTNITNLTNINMISNCNNDETRIENDDVIVVKVEQIDKKQEIIKKEYTVNGVSFKMCFVEGGTFFMGSNDNEAEDKEKPVHRVTLSDYYIGETVVTQALWKAVMGKVKFLWLFETDDNPSYFKGDNLPVEQVSWYDCQKFISKLNSMTGMNFRLPTEAEWEFAARGGIYSLYTKFSGSNNIDDVAWYYYNSGHKTHPVGTKQANELGIYDMTGNVWEQCSDRYGRYSSSSQTNPTGPNTGSSPVYRGGGWGTYACYSRVSYRCRITLGGCGNLSIGLRLVLVP